MCIKTLNGITKMKDQPAVRIVVWHPPAAINTPLIASHEDT